MDEERREEDEGRERERRREMSEKEGEKERERDRKRGKRASKPTPIYFFIVMVSIVDGECRLTDFGFGCLLLPEVEGGKRTSVVGTAFWMAPEGGERERERESA